jgi:predicted nucleic acid-binding protein
MAYKRLFIDSDILLDTLLKREPFHSYAQILLMECEKRNVQLNTSALVISNVHYVLSRSIGSPTSRNKIKELIKAVKVLSFENDIVDLALDSNFTDFEDAIQYLIAKRYNCEAIITRNVRDFKGSDVTVFTPEMFLKTLN